jgi:hypothetical protein
MILFLLIQVGLHASRSDSWLNAIPQDESARTSFPRIVSAGIRMNSSFVFILGMAIIDQMDGSANTWMDAAWPSVVFLRNLPYI